MREALRERAVENMMSLAFFPTVDALIDAADEFSGFVSIGPAPISQDDLDRLYEALSHGVFIDINPAPALFHSVRPDLQQTVIDAIYTLREQGRQRIAFIGGAGHMMGSHVFAQDPRTVAFNEWAHLLDMPTDGYVCASGPFTVENGRSQAEALLDACTDDLPTLSLSRLIRWRLASFRCSLPVGSVYQIRLPSSPSTILRSASTRLLRSAPMRSIAPSWPRTALMLLSDAIVGRFMHKHHVLLSTRLVVRQSFIPANGATAQ